ncbi:PucR family transcriptional regulator [Actinobacteria bacterium YIM 96077]|uniref:PucR family transcriptional regulator n=1 Tax=Phytoactinopolyspora halophila TaxID=1981511 RepID=A0A329QNX8_9ACTN|nr:PucR family transcriptional regulator ligand-binding domain-containing protein [Phytoactinopolyspora halophila]AYY14559.1 PucR family transcriptional regulator [Actinobacteria bacterium YIM 96077]RAW14065.1 PucR family transcriptional regulator [Phytoactinopolyspora halophila]
MLPSVTDVVAMPEVRQGRPRVIAGASGLDRRVRWVHSAEVSDIARLLRGGDLVLTTGIALPADDAGLAAYVADLVTAGAAGLIVELGRRWTDELPEAMVDACEDAGLPLIAWAREVRFARVTEAVAERVVDTQLAELRAADQMHRTFTELSVSGAEPAQILAEIRRISGLPVVLESTRHHILGFDLGDADVTEVLDDWENRSRAVVTDQFAERTAYDDAAGWLVTVVGARGDDWGRLILICPEEPPNRLVVLAERGASALALQRLAARDRESLERQTHRTLLGSLTSGNDVNQELVARCAAAGVPLVDRLLVGIVALPTGDVPTSAPAFATQERLRDLAEITAGTARRAGIPALVGVVDDEAVRALLSMPRDTGVTGAVDDLARRLHHAVAAAPRPIPIVVGAGTTVEDAPAVRRSLAEARHVASAALRASGRADVACHRLGDVRLRGLIQLLRDDERLTDFAERELGPLVAYDHGHGTDLMAILCAFLQHGGHKSAAADAVHLSRPAFYERLSRIERVLGVDLSDPESVTSLHVALLARAGRE